MTDLEIVNALHHMLFNGGHPLSLLVSGLHKLSILDRCVGTTLGCSSNFSLDFFIELMVSAMVS